MQPKKHAFSLASFNEARILTFSDLDTAYFLLGLGPSLPFVEDQSHPNLIHDLGNQYPASSVSHLCHMPGL